MDETKLSEIIKVANIHKETDDENTIKLIMNENRILASHTLPGVNVDAKETKNGIDVKIIVEEGIIVEKPVHFCFGVLHKDFKQNIDLDVLIKKGAKITVTGHCIFMGNNKISHIMHGKVKIEDNADFTYFERHIHSDSGNIEVYPNAKIIVGKNARYRTEFELIQGLVGTTEFNYEVDADDDAVIEMEARMYGKANDKIKIIENANLHGARSRAVLKSRVAAKGNAKAEVYNTIRASGDSAKGHVDCREVLQENGNVQAYPNVEVLHPKAHVTHEASLGGVDNKQLETLMARGLSEDDAEDLIIKGMLT
ncbi:MAG: SufB/SufD family protein [Candidatus Woesearchaeota archaeon]